MGINILGSVRMKLEKLHKLIKINIGYDIKVKEKNNYERYYVSYPCHIIAIKVKV